LARRLVCARTRHLESNQQHLYEGELNENDDDVGLYRNQDWTQSHRERRLYEELNL